MLRWYLTQKNVVKIKILKFRIFFVHYTLAIPLYVFQLSFQRKVLFKGFIELGIPVTSTNSD